MKPNIERNRQIIKYKTSGKSFHWIANICKIKPSTVMEIYYREISRNDKRIKVPVSVQKYTWQR